MPPELGINIFLAGIGNLKNDSQNIADQLVDQVQLEIERIVLTDFLIGPETVAHSGQSVVARFHQLECTVAGETMVTAGRYFTLPQQALFAFEATDDKENRGVIFPPLFRRIGLRITVEKRHSLFFEES